MDICLIFDTKRGQMIKRAMAKIREQGLLTFLAKAWEYQVMEFLRLPSCKRRIKAMQSISDPQRLIELVYSDLGKCLGIKQKRAEIAEFIGLVAERKPQKIIEIGTARGGTLFLLAHVSSPDSRILSIDLPGGPFGGGYPRFKSGLLRRFGGRAIRLLRADSHRLETFQKAKYIIDGEVDLLFIDGDHTYEGVKMDFQRYSPLVKKGGIIALHDIAEHPPETGCDVRRFWQEIRPVYRTKEIIDQQGEPWGGIGIVFLD